jgi:hypothetical protein
VTVTAFYDADVPAELRKIRRWVALVPSASWTAVRRAPKLAFSFFLLGTSWSIVKPESSMSEFWMGWEFWITIHFWWVYAHGRSTPVNRHTILRL